MLVATEKNPGFSLNTEKENFTIAQNNEMFDVLCDRIYSDKIKAVIRELSTNAIDSHIDAGITDRFHIKLPKFNNDEFYIQDFGTGLCKEDTMKLYTTYGYSTKKQDNSKTGFMGLGSKSWWAVSDMATIISVHNGLKHTFVCSRDKNSNQTIHCMSGNGVSTNERNGLKLSFKVKADYIDYIVKAKQIFYYFEEKYLPIDVSTGQVFAIDKRQYEFTENTYKFEFVNNRQTVKIISGNIGYDCNNSYIQDCINQFLGSNFEIEIFMPLGTIVPNAGRESIKYTDTTVKNIEQAIKDIHNSIRDKLKNKLSNYSSNLEFIVGLNSTKNYKIFLKNLSLNGSSYKDIINNFITLAEKDASFQYFNYDGYSRRYYAENFNTHNTKSIRLSQLFNNINDKDYIKFILKDLAHNYLTKISHNLKNQIVIITDDLQSIQDMTSLLGVDYQKVSDLPDAPPAPAAAPKISNTKKSKVFTFDRNGGQKFTSNDASTYWKEDDVDFDAVDGYYLEIKNYISDGVPPYLILKQLSLYECFNTKIDEIYGVKTAHISKIKNSTKKWTELLDFLKKANDDIIKKEDLIRKYRNYLIFANLLDNSYSVSGPAAEVEKFLNLSKKFSSGPFFDLYNILDKAMAEAKKFKYDKNHTNIVNYIKHYHYQDYIDYKLDYITDIENIRKKYEILEFLGKGSLEVIVDTIKKIIELEEIKEKQNVKSTNGWI